jgi:hypothetical protein
VELNWSFDMIDRRLLGDVALAILIAIPSASLAHTDGGSVGHKAAAAVTPNSPNAVIAPDRHVGLFR